MAEVRSGDRRMHFLTTIPKQEATDRWWRAIRPEALGSEQVSIDDAWGRTLATDAVAPIDLPPFARSLVDGFAVRAKDTFGAGEGEPRALTLVGDPLAAGMDPGDLEVPSGGALEIATGAPIPRGANAVVMVEYTELPADGSSVEILRAAVPSQAIQAAGSDVRRGEVLFRRGERLGARETGVLAAQGIGHVEVFTRPRVAVVSTGDELRKPGGPLSHGAIYDSNARVVADLCREHGAEPHELGIVGDDPPAIRAMLKQASEFDMVVLSGGTSKGAGDFTYRLINEIGEPGVVVHGVAMKPGKPVVLAAWGRTPVMILPGFPTSAVITFGLFGLPMLRRLGGLQADEGLDRTEARLAWTIPSEPGRHEYVLVDLTSGGADGEQMACPLLRGSGSVSAFARADGYLEVDAASTQAERGKVFPITLLRGDRRAPDLTFAGSHCFGIDIALAQLRDAHGLRAKSIHVGSQGGLAALRNGSAEVAGIHLLDSQSGLYNVSFVDKVAGAVLVHGWRRRQGIVCRHDDLRQLVGDEPPGPEQASEVLLMLAQSGLRLLNRNRGSGTRVLLDSLLATWAARSGKSMEAYAMAITGYDVEARSHTGVAVAVASGRADYGLAIEPVARQHGLAFVPLTDEHYDLVMRRDRLHRGPVARLLEVVKGAEFREALERLDGYCVSFEVGNVRDPEDQESSS